MNEEAQNKSAAPVGSAPKLAWHEDGVPRAEQFDDTYFSRAGGLEETRHVFLSGNGLPERFGGRKTFAIGEFGFGTGLNFLATVQALKSVGLPPDLTFLSFELYPMDGRQLEKALTAFPELGRLSEALLSAWAPAPGWNHMTVEGVDLYLGVGDARQMIGDLQTGPFFGLPAVPPIDAWYLDGFSPAKNPELWDPELLSAAARLTAPDGTLATYTSAGWVRRNLQSAGFAVEKVKGFAGKREMVTGRKSDRQDT